MKARRFTPHDEAVHVAPRVIVGTCPDCGLVVVVLNAHEVWPWVECVCGWGGATDAVRDYHRFARRLLEHGG